MGRGGLSDAEWELIGSPLPSGRDLLTTTGGFCTVCFTCCGWAAPGETCTNAMASGTRSMCGSDAEQNRVFGMPRRKRWSIWALPTTGSM